MASGPKHYREAERLLDRAQETGVLEFIDRAQVHATLALVAATALGGLGSGDWQDVALHPEKRDKAEPS